MKVLAVAFLLSVAIAPEARALTGVEFYNLCQSNNFDNLTACNYYILGFASGMQVTHANGLIRSHNSYAAWYCPPTDGLSVAQGRLIIEKYLREHPEDLHIDTAILVSEALSKAFSCAGK